MPIGVGVSDQMGSYNQIVQQALLYLEAYTGRGDIESIENVIVYGDLIVDETGNLIIPNSLKVKWGDGIVNTIINSNGMSISNDDVVYTRKVAGEATKLYKANISSGLPSDPNVVYLILGIYFNNRFYSLYNISDYYGHGSQINACMLDGIHKDNLTQYLGWQIAAHGTKVLIPEMFRVDAKECVFCYTLYQIDDPNGRLTCNVDEEGNVICKSDYLGKETYGYLKVWVSAKTTQNI